MSKFMPLPDGGKSLMIYTFTEIQYHLDSDGQICHNDIVLRVHQHAEMQ